MIKKYERVRKNNRNVVSNIAKDKGNIKNRKNNTFFINVFTFLKKSGTISLLITVPAVERKTEKGERQF